MIKISKKDYETILLQILNAKDMREIAGLIIKSYRFGLVISDLSLGEKSPNYHILKNFASVRKINEKFLIDQSVSAISIIKPESDEMDYYKILDSNPDVSAEELRYKWINMMKKYHPDKVGESGLEKTKQINEAYTILSDDIKRKSYDDSYLQSAFIKVIDPSENQFSNKTFVSIVIFIFLTLGTIYFYNTRKISNLHESSITNSKYEPPLVNNKENVDLTRNEGQLKNEFSAEIAGDKTDEIIKKTDHSDSVGRQSMSGGYDVKSPENTSEDVQTRTVKTNNYPGDVNQHNSEHDGKVEVLSMMKNESLNSKDNTTDEKEDKTDSKNVNSKTKTKDYEKNQIQGNRIVNSHDFVIENQNDMPAKSYLSDSKIKDKVPANEGVKTDTPAGNRYVSQSNNVKSEIPSTEIRTGEERNYLAVTARHSDEPDKSSVYHVISDYINAYKNRDMVRLQGLFSSGARENGKVIQDVFKKYRDNFERLNILAYDIKFDRVNLNNNRADVYGDFIITFRTNDNHESQRSSGNIYWNLFWDRGSWLIKEINYEVSGTNENNAF